MNDKRLCEICRQTEIEFCLKIRGYRGTYYVDVCSTCKAHIMYKGVDNGKLKFTAQQVMESRRIT